MTAGASLYLTPAEVRARVAAAVDERSNGMLLAELADTERGGWFTSLLDQAIAWMAQTGQPFSANDVREVLPDDFPSQGLMGSRFHHAANNLRLIRQVRADSATGMVASTKRNTHGKPVALWVGIDASEAA